MKWQFLLLLLFLFSCTDRSSHCIVTNSELLETQKGKIVIVTPKSTLVNDLVDRGKDSITNVGYYTFYNNGNIKSYKFFVSKQAYVYNEEYDQQGNLVKVEGTPIVHTNTRVVNRDSSIIQFFFSTLNRTFDSTVSISINNKKSVTRKMIDDSVRSNMKYVILELNTTGIDSVSILLKSKYTKNCTNETISLADTVSFRPVL